ncbi:hypothetical protein MTX78_07780 [Hymenobacter tibetensis]|uniref:Uncharacterized protein n=1 Tax=Hymenobacter tibetensis TaxID=497967 RepID=A0ABY4D1T4_9BACT|nr:hypothetical protein [Hymenobacter tibetensis]UOG76488.1 hypothetical protein MTX78_07780 [Hymenobacter tibetensis]
MTSLSSHSPAELLLLLEQYHNPSLRQLLRVTFLDLLRQQVLAISTEQYRPHFLDPVTWQQFVIGGPALATYQALPHEALLINALQADDQLRIPFKQYVRMIFGKAQTPRAYYQLIEENMRTGQLFSHHWFWRLTQIRYLTPKGKQLQAATENELARLDKEFASRVASNPSDARQFSQHLGGMLFLLPSFSSEVGHQLERELRQIPEPAHDLGSDFSGGDGGDFSWPSHSDTFDSHCGGHGESDSSGCGGDSDSGCGGDSGCSGCGGCGGD